MLTDLQQQVGTGPVIANHAYGPPHDQTAAGSVDFAMMEFFRGNNISIQEVIMCAKAGRGVVAHGVGGEDDLAAFLIAAG